MHLHSTAYMDNTTWLEVHSSDGLEYSHHCSMQGRQYAWAHGRITSGRRSRQMTHSSRFVPQVPVAPWFSSPGWLSWLLVDDGSSCMPPRTMEAAIVGGTGTVLFGRVPLPTERNITFSFSERAVNIHTFSNFEVKIQLLSAITTLTQQELTSHMNC